MKNAVLKVLALCTVASAYTAPALAFSDPLDLPATLSERALSSPLFGLSADGHDHIVTVGPRGHILHSEDGGKHFTQSPVPLSSDLVAVHFPSESKGWAVGHDGVILHSDDGGKSWQRQLDGRQIGDISAAYYASLSDTNENIERAKEYAQILQETGAVRPLLDVYFEDDNNGWVIGAFNLILHTTDGGKHWTPWMDRTENSEEYSLHAIRKIGGQLYIAGELGLAMRLDPEQQRFIRLQTPYSGSFFGLTGREGLLLLFGLRGNVYTSPDHGQSWRKLETKTPAAINAGIVLDDGRFVLATARGELLFSNLSGDAIEHQTSAGRLPVYGLATAGDALVTIGPKGLKVIAQQ